VGSVISTSLDAFRLLWITRCRGHGAVIGHRRKVVDGWPGPCNEDVLMSLLVARTKVASEMRVRVKKGRAKKTVHVDEVNLSNLLSKTIQALAPPFSERLQQVRSSRRAEDIDL
jgi:hypothetical protein